MQRINLKPLKLNWIRQKRMPKQSKQITTMCRQLTKIVHKPFKNSSPWSMRLKLQKTKRISN